MFKKTSLFLSMAALAATLSFPAFSMADNLPPLTGEKTAKKFDLFRKKAGTDFLLPQVFKNHPGVTFMLSHAKDLGLSDKQVKKLKVIRRHMLDRSLAQMKKIESLRASYLKMASTSHPSPSRIHKDLHAIAWLMAQATADHLAGHLAAANVLSRSQQDKISTLK